MTSRLLKFLGAAGVVALTAWGGQALAIEGNTPYLPGISVGTPAGALPPPGFYFSDDNVIINGGLKDNNGNNVGANVTAYLNIPAVLWAPGLNILGATYAAALVQPYSMQNLDFSGIGGGKAISQGLFNTIFSPLNLGWNFNPFFVKFGVAVYADDGYIQTVSVPASAGIPAHRAAGAGNIANNFWTVEPDLGLTYLQNGWDFTAHFIFDLNTENTDTNYQSGNLFFLDLTAARNIGKWVVGGGGNFTQQMNCDSGSGNFNGCNKLQHIMMGPLIGYNFGPVEIDAKALFNIRTENGFGANFYHISFSFPF
jgi:hypothetical protein